MKTISTFILLFILLNVLASCDSPQEQADQLNESREYGAEDATLEENRAEETAHDNSDTALTSLEREVNVLITDGNTIGPEHYAALNTRLEKLRGKRYDENALKDLEQKIAQLNPDKQDAIDFREVKRQIEELYDDKLIIGDDRAAQYAQQLDAFENKGIAVSELRTKLQSLTHNEKIKTKGRQNPAVAKDFEIIDQLPECNNQTLTVSPVDLNELSYGISPLGNINPPGHTLPTPHLYFHLSARGASTRMVSLKSPGDVHIIEISSSHDDLGGIEEYNIGFALCKEVYGYFKHVKGLSQELKQAMENATCNEANYNPGGRCSKRMVYAVAAGTVIGEVGHKQGNFDFGAYDYRVKLNYVNPASYGDITAEGFGRPRLLSGICPLDLYKEPTKSQIYAKVNGNNNPKCGNLMQDIPGTLQGSWFADGGRADLEWEKHLTFAYDNENPALAIIAVAGIIGDPLRREFTPASSGQSNRKFSEVRTDGKIYCYDTSNSGKLIVQLNSETEIKIESQSGSCSAQNSFTNPILYHR